MARDDAPDNASYYDITATDRRGLCIAANMEYVAAISVRKNIENYFALLEHTAFEML